MSARLLVVVFAGQEANAARGLPALLAATRHDHAVVRIACFRDLPPPRVDRYDRVVVDADREMARITGATVAAFDGSLRQLGHDPVEVVVRFGAPGREVSVETDAFIPGIVAFFAPPPLALSTRLRIWSLRRLARHRATRLLFIETPRTPRSSAVDAPAPAFP